MKFIASIREIKVLLLCKINWTEFKNVIYIFKIKKFIRIHVIETGGYGSVV